MLIDTFINAIFLYDDKMLITFNYKDGTKTITFGEAKEAAEKAASGSDLDCSTAPYRNEFCSFRFFMGNALPVFAPVCLLPAFWLAPYGRSASFGLLPSAFERTVFGLRRFAVIGYDDRT